MSTLDAGSTRATLRYELVALWLSALKTIFVLINSFPNLRTISFHETYQVSTYESNRPLNPWIFEGSAIFENEASLMVSRLSRVWEKSQTSTTFESNFIKSESSLNNGLLPSFLQAIAEAQI
ncbi:hypothetical protein M422DRAFT_242915 [Sphaerobolus stellatus SS14]|nr:hypothetical protein M422DRAFT_242915 [Sphaerobolus stellatus SS14]